MEILQTTEPPRNKIVTLQNIISRDARMVSRIFYDPISAAERI
jgi:hypothetical protein